MNPQEEEEKVATLLQQFETHYASHKPIVIPTFLLTYGCNFRCSYCYEKHVRKKGKEAIKQRITPEMVRGLFQYFTDHAYTAGDVTLFGGEPLLPENEDVVREILDQAKARDLYVSVVTNGYTLDSYAPLLSKVKLRTIQITLDGDRERHNRIVTSFIHHDRSAPRYFCCSAHHGQMIFDPWGHIYPCQTIVGEEEQIIGHYDAAGVYFNERYAMWESRNLTSMEKCRECALGLFCGGGCAIYSLHTDEIMGPTGCERMESLCTVLLPYLYRKFLREKAG